MNIPEQLINGFIKSELELFIKQFDERFIPDIQDQRSLAIAWLCYYFKDSVSSENSSSIIQFVEKVHLSANYCTYGWMRISALQASAFILTGDIYYANSLIQHIDCGQGWARGYIIESASIICPLLSFGNHQLKKATETNIKYFHTYYEENVILYLSTNGTAEEKVNWLEHQISISNDDYLRKFFNRLKSDGDLNKSGFFVRMFSKVKSYIIFKMLCQPSFAEFQLNLFSDLDFNKLTKLENKHPLNDYYIDLSFLSNDK